MVTAIALIVGGLILLTGAADRFVLSAARLARAWGVSPILIGALIVGMGTSAPEFIVSVIGGSESFDLAMGNIIGSNVSNLTLVLGASVLVSPIAGQRRILRREGLLMVFAVALFTALLWNGDLTRTDGIVLAVGMVVAALLLMQWARRDSADGILGEEGDEDGEENDLVDDGGEISIRREVVMGLLTLITMIIGANLLKDGALDLARIIGMSEGFVGLSIVAIGTSLPELATAVSAARRRQNDLVVGNLLGSNLFNSLAVAGGVGLIQPGVAAEPFLVLTLVMLGVAMFSGILTFTGNRLVRAEGLVLLAVFAAYLPFSA